MRESEQNCNAFALAMVHISDPFGIYILAHLFVPTYHQNYEQLCYLAGETPRPELQACAEENYESKDLKCFSLAINS